MSQPLSQRIAESVIAAANLYHRLVLVVGPTRSGKTTALNDLALEQGWPFINVNLTLSERLLELTVRQRSLRCARIVEEILGVVDSPVVLLDNLEMLFQPELAQDPLRLLQSLSRDRTVIATWRGHLQGGALIYASPEHPEYRRYDDPQSLIVISAEASFPARRVSVPPQEQTA